MAPNSEGQQKKIEQNRMFADIKTYAIFTHDFIVAAIRI